MPDLVKKCVEVEFEVRGKAVAPDTVEILGGLPRFRGDLTVDFRGRVESARLLSGGVTYFDERALEAVRTWRFEPARRNGRPVSTAFLQPVHFRRPARTTAAPEP